MKTIYAIVGLLLTIFVTGCQDEEYSKRSTSAVKVFASAPSTRVNYTEDGDRTLVTWNNGDKILLFTDEQSVYYTASVQKDGTTDVELLPSGDFLQNSEGKAVYALYSSADEYSINDKKVRFGWNLVGNNDRQIEPYLYAVDTIRDGKLNLHFHHVLSYLKVTITKDMLPASVTDGKLNRIDILSDGFNIGASEIEFDLDRREITDTIMSAFSVTRSLEEHDFTASDFMCYMPIIPRTARGSINVSLSIDNTTASYYTLEKKVPDSGFLAGHVYKLTLDDYYEYSPGGIYTLEDLLAYREAFYSYESLEPWRDKDGVINIFSDIDATSIKSWNFLIDNSSIIEGNGHTIKIDMTHEYGEAIGLFANNRAVIRNLNMEGKLTIKYSPMVIPGGLFGFCERNYGTIYNCHSNIAFDGEFAGGICYENIGKIEACTNRGLINVKGGATGGIAVDSKGSIINCRNYAEIKAINNDRNVTIGGIVALLTDSTVVDCYNEGNIISSGGQGMLGGICAYASGRGALNGNINKGSVQGGHIAGGICGVVYTGITLWGNSNTGTINGTQPTVSNPLDIGQDNRNQKILK